MNIAVISFDQDFINQIRRELPDENVRGYIDSLSMLKELAEFNPDIIIYDASSGDFAIDDLKFLLTRDKVEKKKFRILLSREQPVDIDSFPEVEDIIYYTKETDIPKLLSDIKPEGKKEETVHIGTPEPPTPADIESFLESSAFEEGIPEPSVEFAEHFDEFAVSEEEEKEIKESLEHMSKKEKPVVEDTFSFVEEPLVKEELTPEPKPEKKTFKPSVQTSGESIKLEIDISLDEIKRAIAKEAVNQLVEKLLKDPEMGEIINNIQRDFVSRTEEEFENIKNEIKTELKEKLTESIEQELKNSLVQSIKEDVAQLTAKMVKEKLEQLFGGR